MNDEKCRVGDYLPAGVPEDDETAQVLVLTVLAYRYPEGMTVLALAAELSNEGDDWVERAVRDLAVTELIRCDHDQVFATFGFPDLRYPEQSGSQSAKAIPSPKANSEEAQPGQKARQISSERSR